MGSTFQIIIKDLKGKYITIDIEPNATVSELKQKIYEKEKVPERHQRLIYSGKQLEEGNTLSFYHISRDSTIRLVSRLEGGKL